MSLFKDEFASTIRSYAFCKLNVSLVRRHVDVIESRGDSAMTRSLEKIVIDWMSNKGAPEWHGVAVNWNWDIGVEPLLWIVDQPECDKATALTVFWWSEPFYYMEKGSPEDETYQLVYRILGNWKRYSTTRFKFQLPDYVQNLHSRLSQECLEALHPLMLSVDGQERYPNYGQAGPAECYIAYLELIGEPVTDLERETLARERAGEKLSETDEEVAARHRREREQWFSEWQDVITFCEEILDKEK